MRLPTRCMSHARSSHEGTKTRRLNKLDFVPSCLRGKSEPLLAVIAITIVVSAAGRERMAHISADAYLAKPIDMDELLSRVEQFCHTV